MGEKTAPRTAEVGMNPVVRRIGEVAMGAAVRRGGGLLVLVGVLAVAGAAVRRGGGLLVLVGVLALAAPAGARPADRSAPAASPSAAASQPSGAGAPVCREPRSAIDRVVRTVAASLGALPPTALVVTTPLRSEVRAPKARQLALLLAEQLAGRLGPATRIHPEPLAPAAARDAAAGAPGWVLLQPEVVAGRLRLTADAFPIPPTVWARALATQPGPMAHGFAEAPVDAEVRIYLEAISFAPPVVSKFKGSDPGVVALACGDLDHDGALDLYAATRHRVLRTRLRDGKVKRLGEARWSAHLPVAPVPLRQPIGSATVVPPRASGQAEPYLDVALTDRAGSLRFGPGLKPVASLEGLAVPAGAATACTRLKGVLLDPALEPCRPEDPIPALGNLGRPYDALAAALIVDATGQPTAWAVRRTDRHLVLWSDRGAKHPVGGGGAQVALGDLDQDGAVDVVLSLDVFNRKQDALVVRSLRRDGQLQHRYRLPVPTGVDAVTLCPPDGPGRAAIVMATGTELWVLR